jgi:regulatory protein
MAVVTAIVPSTRKEGRFDLALDGATAGRVSLDIVERFGLRVGVVLDDARRAELDEAMETLATYDRALNLLAAQARSRRDLRRRLLQKGEQESRVDAALDRLAAGGLLNDDAFARQFARSRVLGRGASKRRVRDELYRRGVAGVAADEAIAEVFEDEQVDEAALVEAAARKKLRTLDGMDAQTRRRRLYAFLARRGHDAVLIRATMSRVLSQTDVAELEDDATGLDDDAPKPGWDADDAD